MLSPTRGSAIPRARRRFAIPVLVLALLTGCQIQSVTAREDQKHFVFVGTRGEPVDLLDRSVRLSREDFDRHLEFIHESILDQLASTPLNQRLHIVVHVHGGLVPFDGALSKNLDNLERIRAENTEVAAGEREQEHIYPIFVNWPGAFPGTLKDHLLYVRQGTDFRDEAGYARFLNWLATPLVLVADVGMAAARTPLNLGRMAATDYYASPLGDDSYWNQGDLAEDHAYEAFHIERGEDEPLGFWRHAWAGTTYLVTLPIKITSVFLIDAFGTHSWDLMKRRTQLATWRGRALRDGANRDVEGAVQSLGRTLTSTIAANQDRIRLSLVGHSMGSFVINAMIDSCPDLHIDEIVYMAAACPIRDARDAIVPVMRDHPELKFYNLSLHPRAELREQGALDLWQRGSLLIWIDNFLEKPLGNLGRTLGQSVNILNALHVFPPELRNRIYLREFSFGTSYAAEQPQAHAEFNDKRFWAENFWWPQPNDR